MAAGASGRAHQPPGELSPAAGTWEPQEPRPLGARTGDCGVPATSIPRRPLGSRPRPSAARSLARPPARLTCAAAALFPPPVALVEAQRLGVLRRGPVAATARLLRLAAARPLGAVRAATAAFSRGGRVADARHVPSATHCPRHLPPAARPASASRRPPRRLAPPLARARAAAIRSPPAGARHWRQRRVGGRGGRRYGRRHLLPAVAVARGGLRGSGRRAGFHAAAGLRGGGRRAAAGLGVAVRATRAPGAAAVARVRRRDPPGFGSAATEAGLQLRGSRRLRPGGSAVLAASLLHIYDRLSHSLPVDSVQSLARGSVPTGGGLGPTGSVLDAPNAPRTFWAAFRESGCVTAVAAKVAWFCHLATAFLAACDHSPSLIAALRSPAAGWVAVNPAQPGRPSPGLPA